MTNSTGGQDNALHTRRITELEKLLRDAAAAIVAVRDERDGAQEAHNYVYDRFGIANGEITQLQGQVATLTANLRTQKIALEADLTAARTAKTAAESEAARLRGQVTTLTADLRTANADKATANAQLANTEQAHDVALAALRAARAAPSPAPTSAATPINFRTVRVALLAWFRSRHWWYSVAAGYGACSVLLLLWFGFAYMFSSSPTSTVASSGSADELVNCKVDLGLEKNSGRSLSREVSAAKTAQVKAEGDRDLESRLKKEVIEKLAVANTAIAALNKDLDAAKVRPVVVTAGPKADAVPALSHECVLGSSLFVASYGRCLPIHN